MFNTLKINGEILCFCSSPYQTCVLIIFNGVELPERTGPLIHLSVAPWYICEQFE